MSAPMSISLRKTIIAMHQKAGRSRWVQHHTALLKRDEGKRT